MRILPYFFLMMTLLCLMPVEIQSETTEVSERFFFLVRLLKYVVPVGRYIVRGIRALRRRRRRKNRRSGLTTDQEVMGQLVDLSTKLGKVDSEMKARMDSTVTTLLRTYPKAVELELILHDLTQIKNQIKFADEQMRFYLLEGYKNISQPETESNIKLRIQDPPTKPSPDFTPLEQMSSNSSNATEVSKRIMEQYTMIDFATWAVGHSYNSLMSLLRRMHDLVIRGERGLFEKLADLSQPNDEIISGITLVNASDKRKRDFGVVDSLQKILTYATTENLNEVQKLPPDNFQRMGSNVCSYKYSPYQTLYNLYKTIAVVELKGNSVLQFAYTILKMYRKGEFTSESNLAVKAYAKQSKEKIQAVVKVLPSVERSIYNCEMRKQVDGETYTYLVKFQQAYIENEVNLNSGRNCWKGCAHYSPKTKYYGCYGDLFCSKQKQCRGSVLNCREVPRDLKICRSTKNDRRYDWIKIEGGTVYGKGGSCSEDNYFTLRNWYRYLYWKCSYCLCVCDDKSRESDRYFNLRSVLSDVGKNKVVTGVRIVKNNQIIHLQIQEGVLKGVGAIETSTLSWKPVDNYTIWDEHVKNYEDYFTMDNESRALDMNEMTAKPGYVVTGVRFRKRNNHVDLDVHVTPFNYTSGKLELVPSTNCYWISENETYVQTGSLRNQIILSRPDVPIGLGPHVLNSKKDQYVLFQETDLEKDAGQSTVPFFDSRPLTTRGYALSGFGLIHRGRSGSGGFVAPLLVSYDYAAHLGFTQSE